MDIGTKSIKEETDMILEPLQVMVQLALLAYCPIGTKVSVSNNILQIQRPTLFQGVWRWYNQDGKDDLYYLFHAIRRYSGRLPTTPCGSISPIFSAPPQKLDGVLQRVQRSIQLRNRTIPNLIIKKMLLPIARQRR